MSTVAELRENHKLTLTNLLCGAEYQVERLPRRPGQYAKGFRLVHLHQEPFRPTYHVHQLPDGRHECGCTGWTDGRECEHTRLLTAAGLFDEPVTTAELYQGSYFQEDELLDLDWESDAS